jgi:hypothetical protein
VGKPRERWDGSVWREAIDFLQVQNSKAAARNKEGCRKETGGTVVQQDRQCTCNVTWRHVCELLLPWENNEYYIFVCVRMRVGAQACGHVHASASM